MISMSPEELVEEYRDTVLELHLTRRRVQALEQENQALRAQHSHPQEEGGSRAAPEAAKPQGAAQTT